MISYNMKIWEKIIERIIRKEKSISNNPLGFILGKSMVALVFYVREIVKKYREKKNLFVDILDLKNLMTECRELF